MWGEVDVASLMNCYFQEEASPSSMKESMNAIFVMLSLYIFVFTSMYKFTCCKNFFKSSLLPKKSFRRLSLMALGLSFFVSSPIGLSHNIEDPPTIFVSILIVSVLDSGLFVSGTVS